LGILGCDVFAVCVLVNLPLSFNPDVGGSAIAGLVGNLAVMGGILYLLRREGTPSAPGAKPAPAITNSALGPVFCLRDAAWRAKPTDLPDRYGAPPITSAGFCRLQVVKTGFYRRPALLRQKGPGPVREPGVPRAQP